MTTPVATYPLRSDARREYAEIARLAGSQLEAMNGLAPDPRHPYRSLLRKALRDLRSMSVHELRDLARDLGTSLAEAMLDSDAGLQQTQLNRGAIV